MKMLDLFSGIGGFSLAAEWAGIETVAFCEPEPFCRKVLKKHWPNVPAFYDVRRLNGKKINKRYGPIDIVSGGFPCQPFSVAGKRRGSEDDRALWPEMFRIIKEVRPAWVIGENVIGIINMELDKIISDLEGEKYRVRTFIIPACAVDAPHRRDRVWIVANSEGKRLEGANTTRETRTWRRNMQRNRMHRWPTEPGVDRVDNGIPNRVDRLKGLGNAIVPRVAYEILKTIFELNKQERR